jgi:hypothetical protein
MKFKLYSWKIMPHILWLLFLAYAGLNSENSLISESRAQKFLFYVGYYGNAASCTMGTGSFPGIESGRGVTLTTSSAEI